MRCSWLGRLLTTWIDDNAIHRLWTWWSVWWRLISAKIKIRIINCTSNLGWSTWVFIWSCCCWRILIAIATSISTTSTSISSTTASMAWTRGKAIFTWEIASIIARSTGTSIWVICFTLIVHWFADSVT